MKNYYYKLLVCICLVVATIIGCNDIIARGGHGGGHRGGGHRGGGHRGGARRGGAHRARHSGARHGKSARKSGKHGAHKGGRGGHRGGRNRRGAYGGWNRFNNFNGFWWGTGLGLGLLGWWSYGWWYSPWWWWGYAQGSYDPWYFDALYTTYTKQPVEEQVEGQASQDLSDKLNTGLKQQANALILLGDQLKTLEPYIGAQHQAIETIEPVQEANAIAQNLADQAKAIRTLAQIVTEDQKQLGTQFGAIDLQGIDVQGKQNGRAYLDSARNQAKAVNQIASVVVRLQHKVGIASIQETQKHEQPQKPTIAQQPSK